MNPAPIPMFTWALPPGKLLISMVPRNKGDALVDASKAAGARGGTITLGRSVVDNRFLQILSLADSLQDIVFTLMREESEAVIEALTEAYRTPSGKSSGIAMLLDVPQMLIRVKSEGPESTPNAVNARSEKMESGYTLLTVIVNHGYADDVMDKARKAGASGGTILNARGTGTEEDVKFFGITLVPEKEVLMIVAENSKTDAILDAIRKVPALAEPGGGIAYAMNVERFVVLGK